VLRDLTAGKKTVSNQHLKMSLSIHALFCEKYGSGHGRQGRSKHSGSFSFPMVATGILWLLVAFQAKMRVMRSFAFIAFVPHACRR